MVWYVLGCLFFCILMNMSLFFSPKLKKKSRGVLKKQNYNKPANFVLFCNKKFCGSTYFLKPTQNTKNFQKSKNPNLLGFSQLLTINNKTLKLSNKFLQSGFFRGVYFRVVNNCASEKTTLVSFSLKNITTKELKLKITHKNFLQLLSPQIKCTNEQNIVLVAFEDSTVAVVFYTREKKLRQQVRICKVFSSTMHGVEIGLKPKETKHCKLLISANLTHASTGKELQVEYVSKQTLAANLSKITHDKIIKIASSSAKENLPTPARNVNFLNYKIITQNKQINYLINSFLPRKLLEENGNSFAAVYQLLSTQNVESLKNFYSSKIIEWLLKTQNYARLYTYLLTVVLGVGFLGSIITFEKKHCYMGKIIILYLGEVVKKYNLNTSYYFSHKKIIYKNIKLLNLEKTKLALSENLFN